MKLRQESLISRLYKNVLRTAWLSAFYISKYEKGGYMKREELLHICGGKDWHSNDDNICFTGNVYGKEINFDFSGYKEEEIVSDLGNVIEEILKNFKQLDIVARGIIKDQHKDEDVDILELSDIIFDKSGCYNMFALGYRVGETQAGELYLLIKFDENLLADSDIVYEVY